MPDKLKIDEADLKILSAFLDDSRMTFKELASTLDLDERMIRRRINRLIEAGIIRKFTIDIDWSKLGFDLQGFVGTRTAVGSELRKNLFEFFDSQPRIAYVDSTVGAYEYVVYAICRNVQEFRSKIASPLEPLTAGLFTSIVSHHFKPVDFKPLLSLLSKRLKANSIAKSEDSEESKTN